MTELPLILVIEDEYLAMRDVEAAPRYESRLGGLTVPTLLEFGLGAE
jgi:hypothetical protein